MTMTRSPAFSRSGGIFAASLALVFAGCDSSKPAPASKGPTTPTADTAPKGATAGPVELKATDPAGLAKILEDLKAEKKAVFVDFWATWCGPCRKAFPHTVALARKYKADGLAVVTVALEEDESKREDALKFLTDQGADFTNLLSTTGAEQAFKDFDIGDSGIPHYRIYDTSGELVKKFTNEGLAEEKLAAEIEATLKTALESKDDSK
ncbi:MAG: redoxin family protein [Planctomycetaceae bacterium]|nr:redoxin family protein [Planctomycetaceae bacterium]